MLSSPSSSRRDFLKTAGSLSISIPFLATFWPAGLAGIAAETLPGSLRRTPRINAWLEVLEDGRVRIFSGKVELGQGIRIAIKQVAAEELNLELSQVEIVLADTDRTPNEGYTAGSGSIQNSAMAVRYAAAAAREKLLQLAADKWSLPKEKLLLSKGEVRELGGNRVASLAELLDGQQIEDEVQLPLPLKKKAEYRYVGQPVSREDASAMLTGKPVFVQDMRLPGMLYARVLRPKNYESSLLKLDEAAFRAEAKGLEHLFRNGSFVGVVCKHQYQAEQAVRLLAKHSTWSEPAIFPDFETLPSHIRQIAKPPKIVHESGNIPDDSAGTRLKASYFKPYHMHAAMGPACAVALLAACRRSSRVSKRLSL